MRKEARGESSIMRRHRPENSGHYWHDFLNEMHYNAAWPRLILILRVESYIASFLEFI